MDQDVILIARIRAFFYTARNRQWDKALAALTLALFATAEPFRRVFQNLGLASFSVYALGAAAFLWLALEVRKKAALPPRPLDTPLPTAIKGLFPFIASDSDGELFSRLGRHLELARLMALVQDDQIGISVVRGESGAGKTSLLQAGLQYALGKQGKQRCIYWEAVPTEAREGLLHAIRSQVPGLEMLGSLDSLPAKCPGRCVLILDQMEQLRADKPEHVPIFSLLGRIAESPPPHLLSAVVGFRREYTPDWLDFEQGRGWRAEQIAVNLLAEKTARNVLITLCDAAGFTLDQVLVTNFVSRVTGEGGVSPVDVAIGTLSLANLAQQRGASHLGLTEYKLSGGAEGLLLSFVREKLDEIPEAIRAPLLKGIVFSLADLQNNQRIAAGAPSAVIAEKAGVPEASLAPWLRILAHPRIRLLEDAGSNRYRLSQDRLVPVLRRLAGRALASADQLRIRFEAEYAAWRDNHSSRYLLRGKELRRLLRHQDQYILGENAVAKTEYLTACLDRRRLLRFATVAAGAATMASAWGLDSVFDTTMQKQKLRDWRLPPDLFSAQHELDAIEIGRPVNDLYWLRSNRLRALTLDRFDGASLAGLDQLKNLTSLSLMLPRNGANQLAGLERLTSLSSLSLDLSGSLLDSLAGLERLQGLTSLNLTFGAAPIGGIPSLTKLTALATLTLDLKSSPVSALPDLERLEKLTSLKLDLGAIDSYPIGSLTGLKSLTLMNGWISRLPGLEHLRRLNSLSLTPGTSSIADLTGLRQLKNSNLKSLSIDLADSPISSLVGLEELTSLTRLRLDLTHNLGITDLAPIRRLTALRSLDLNLMFSQIKSLADLEALTNLTSLTLNGYPITSQADWEQLKRLTSLSLDLGAIDNLDGLKQLTRLTSLTLRGNQLKSLVGLEQLTKLASLTLNLRTAPVRRLAPIEQLRGLTTLNLDVRSTNIQSLDDLDRLKTNLTSLKLDLADWHGSGEPHTSSRISSLVCLEQLKSLESAELWLPLNLVSHCAQLKMNAPNKLVGCRLQEV